MTAEGLVQLKEELKQMTRFERHKVIQEIAKAREHGDLSENAEYHAAREKQSFLEGRIKDVESKVARAQVVDPTQIKSERIAFGATVTLYNVETDKESTFQIVGEHEADPKAQRLSITSPMARACIGKMLDDTILLRLPDGTREFEVTGIQYI